MANANIFDPADEEIGPELTVPEVTPETAFNADTVFVRVVASAAMNIKFGASPTAAATDLYIPAATVEILKVPEQGVKFAAIGSGDCYVTEMS